MESWKRTISLCLIAMMLASTFLVFADAEGAPGRASQPTLTNPSVAPSIGNTNTLFNFTVVYTDFDGDVPHYVSIIIDSSTYNMTALFYPNSSYIRGVQFYYRTYLSAGNHSYNFTTMNTAWETACSPSSGSYSLSVQSASAGPQLYTPSYSPSRPDIYNPVNFTVYYRHSNGTAPTHMRVNLTTGNQTTYLTMYPIGTNYTNGVKYFCNYYLSQGYHHYRYEAYVSPGQYAYLPQTGRYQIYVYNTSSNSNPVLSNPGVSPHNPDRGQNTTFWVHYSDADYDIPYLFELRYYRADDRANITSVNMYLGSGNISRGVNCTTVLNFWHNGTYYYFFAVHDAGGGYDITDHYPFHVGDLPQPPRAPFIYHAGHTPSHPTVQDTINFTVTYIDDSGQSIPDYVRFFIANSTSGFTNYTLSPDQTNASMAIHYSYLTPLANDTYYYYFEAKIGRNYSRSPSNGYNWVLVAAQSSPRDTPPQLSSASYTPSNPTAAQNITFTVTYSDSDGDAPLFVNMVIGQPWLNSLTMNTYNMTVSGSSYARGVTATITLRLTANNYGYWFYTISNGSYAYLPTHNYYNLTVASSSHPDHPPTLLRGVYSPSSPVSGSNITFSVTYSDSDGDAPIWVHLYVNPVQSSQPFTMYNMTISGRTYVTGVTASVTLRLSAGNYSYYFIAAQRNLTVSLPATGVSTITVANSSQPQQNRPPTLTNLVVYPTSPTANQTVYFAVTFTDADGDAPSYVKIHILYGGGSGYINFSMAVQRGSYNSGVSCQYSTSFLAGMYYYYFTTAAANHTVTYPSSGVFTLNVASSGTPNRTKLAAIATIRSGSFDVQVINDDFTVTLKRAEKGSVEVEVDPQGVEGGVIALALDRDLLDINAPEDLVVTVNGVRIPYRYVGDPEQMSGDEPFYYIIFGEDGPTLYVYLPDGDIQTITAKTAEETSPDHTWWYVLGAVIVILVIAAIIGVSLLTASQKRKIDAFYEDLDVGIRPGGVLSGKLLNEEDIDWDDLIQE